MIDRNCLLDTAKSVRRKYREMLRVNDELLVLFDHWFPFIKPGPYGWKDLSATDIEMRNQVLSIRALPHDVLRLEREFKEVYELHCGMVNFFKNPVY